MNMNASVRNLPADKMAEIRRMFEKKDENSATPKPAPRAEPRVDTNTGHASLADSPSKQKRSGRSPARPPKPNISPSRNPKVNISPNRQTGVSALTPETTSFTPTPKPRPSVDHKTDHSLGLSALPVGKFGQVAGAIAMSDDDMSANRVSRLVGQLEHNTPHAESSSETSGHEIKETKHNQTNTKSETPVYARLWDGREQKCTPLSGEDGNKDSRPVSVFERLKMFDNISQSSPTPSPGKPAKPPPPVKKVLPIEGQKSSETAEEQQKSAKVRPSRPPIRQRSLVEKTHKQDVDQSSANENSNIMSKKPMMPPSKPPRTGAHDDYVRVKKEKEAETQIDNDDYVDCDFVVIPKDKPDTKAANIPASGEKKPLKPQRPPPPKKKARPFSIATDTVTIGSSENSDSDEKSYDSLSNDHSFYESLEEPLSRAHLNEPIKHWDLPRFSHPEPIRRSLSDDCIPKAVDDAGNIVYFDPKKIATQDSTGYDIYVDSAGYAVPSRLVRRTSSVDEEETENEVCGIFLLHRKLFIIQGPVVKSIVSLNQLVSGQNINCSSKYSI